MKTKKNPESIKQIKETRQRNYPILFSISFVITAFALSILFYNFLPENIITHWGLNGEANGFTPKEGGILFIPLIMTGLLVLLYFLPKIDPLRKNIEDFKGEYHKMILTMTAFFLYLQLVLIILNLGFVFDIRQLLAPAFSGLIYSIGILIRKAKRNFLIGIKTPWTLNSDKVWEKTHLKASNLFKASAILSLIGITVPELAFFFMIIPILTASAWVIIYSYLEYKKEEKINFKKNN
jgi:uncharacterized membrane protein